ncbi:hypothetical protein BDW02DRAFT_583944 [Decorospora gaudefroyi]|uniref:Uncharacterized protein n=1 Tax=Decorospora gaudefroyi TaxID=184978 RepID=A0A6A5JZD7_9PLEO|nr:hypothetical protein BDW02DRAFT_583944 [Decorospora gaudefroyi]
MYLPISWAFVALLAYSFILLALFQVYIDKMISIKSDYIMALLAYSVTIIALDRIYIDGKAWKCMKCAWKRFRKDNRWMFANANTEKPVLRLLATDINKCTNPILNEDYHLLCSYSFKDTVSSWEQETKCDVRCIVKCRPLMTERSVT